MERLIDKLAIVSLLSFSCYIFLELKSALIFSAGVSIILLSIGFAASVMGISKFGSQVTAEIDLNFYETLVVISSLILPLIFLSIAALP